MARIYDNIVKKFTEGMQGIISSLGVKRVDFCVGYFILSDWSLVVDHIGNLPGGNVYENDKRVKRTYQLLKGMHHSPVFPRYFFKYFYVNTATGEKSGDILVQGKLAKGQGYYNTI